MGVSFECGSRPPGVQKFDLNHCLQEDLGEGHEIYGKRVRNGANHKEKK